MKVSIIIPTYNEGGVLRSCIESLSLQSESSFEIIIVDDGSTDNSTTIVRDLTKSAPNLRYYSQNHLGAGAGRNTGAKYATGDILVFVDADMTFDKNFLKNLVKPIVNGKTRGTFSADEYVSNWESAWARCWNINENWERKRRHPKNYPDHQPVFRAILRSEFEKVNGFIPGGYDDDWSLSRKLGYDALESGRFSSSKAIFFHKNPSTLPEVFKHAKWVGKRRYKLGVVGSLVGLVRSSFPLSVLTGFYKGLINRDLRFVIFKTIYDFGVFLGILDYLFTGKSSK